MAIFNGKIMENPLLMGYSLMVSDQNCRCLRRELDRRRGDGERRRGGVRERWRRLRWGTENVVMGW